MAKGRDIAVENIGNVIEVARLRRQSGLLSIEYAHGGHLEEGEVYLHVGLPIYARTGSLTGPDALATILSWQHIYFSFSSDVPRPPANIVPTGRFDSSSPPVDAFPALAGSRAASRVRENGNASFAPDRAEQKTYRGLPVPGKEWLVPRKISVEEDILSLPLSRRQRFIYFLVDSRRTVSDLARCTGKNVQEVELILSELQEQGLVAI